MLQAGLWFISAFEEEMGGHRKPAEPFLHSACTGVTQGCVSCNRGTAEQTLSWSFIGNTHTTASKAKTSSQKHSRASGNAALTCASKPCVFSLFIESWSWAQQSAVGTMHCTNKRQLQKRMVWLHQRSSKINTKHTRMQGSILSWKVPGNRVSLKNRF